MSDLFQSTRGSDFLSNVVEGLRGVEALDLLLHGTLLKGLDEGLNIEAAGSSALGRGGAVVLLLRRRGTVLLLRLLGWRSSGWRGELLTHGRLRRGCKWFYVRI